MGLLQSRICRAVHRVTDLEIILVRISKPDEADEQQVHSMILKTERYPETSANKAKTKSLTRMPTAEKTIKERDCTQMPVAKKERPQMPVAKKERTNHKCWWQTKTDRPNKASQQLTPNEGNKTARTTSKPQTAAYL